MKSSRRLFAGLLMLLAAGAIMFSLVSNIPPVAGSRPASYPGGEPFISGLSDSASPPPGETNHEPVVGQSAPPTAWYGDLRDLPRPGDTNFPRLEMPRPVVIGELPEPSGAVDPLAQTWQGPGQMPDPIIGFEGLKITDGGGWHPPDTDGDVGPNHYIQVVNIAIGIYDKATGAELVNLPYDSFFSPAPPPCNTQNRGDVIVLYDPIVDRWLVTDFRLPSTGPVHECMAISMSGDPVSGGWYYYALEVDADGSPWHDYPKLGVWSDGYYMTANMFDPWSGVWVWAMDRNDMLVGAPFDYIRFETGSAYGSLLPANIRGPLPPAGSPNYLLSVEYPDTLYMWKAYVDWGPPVTGHLDGPISLPVAPFSTIGWGSSIPQRDTNQKLDSIDDRLMYLLQYRNYGDHESLFVNHTVASGNSGGVRWYELRDPGGTPFVYQQGTFQPDDHYRWMGSIAADGDGNVALGYSVSSSSLYPSIRYTGRLNGEPLGWMAQAEASLKEGTGSQTGSNRWGDYSAMSVDPVDDCTFWYTQEYFITTSGNWHTWIGSFRFPSCGQPKGWIAGTVYDAVSLEPLPGVLIVGEGLSTTMTVQTDANGDYVMPLMADTYVLTAGPLLPGYPDPTVVTASVTAGLTTTLNIPLGPRPDLADAGLTVDDDVPGGNANGYAEPGESGLLLWAALANTGATTATNVSAHLVVQTPGVTITVADAAYPDMPEGAVQTNLTPFELAIGPAIPCGGRIDLVNILTTDQGVYTVPARLYPGVPLPAASFFADDIEHGPNGWSTGGTNNLWAISTERSHSPTHAWSDSPGRNYMDNTEAWLRSPTLDLSGVIGTELSFWHRYDLETNWDFGFVQYSLDGGATWSSFPVGYTGYQDWNQQSWATPAFDEQPNVAFRFLLKSDGGVTADGWHIDDVTLTYQPFGCYYLPPAVPTLIAPPDGTVTGAHAITFTWEPRAGGGTLEGYNLDVGGAVYTTTATFLRLNLPAGLYPWTVRAYHRGGASAYADPWTVQVLDPPAIPVLLDPPDGSLFTATHDVTLTWQAGAGESPDSYDLQLDGVTQTVTATTYLTTLSAGDHTWQVRACNLAGCSEYTAAWSLTILDPPGVPVLESPPDGVVITATHDIAFAWQGAAGSPADSYHLEVNGAVYTVSDTIYTLTLPAGPFTWRVQAVNAAGASAYSAPWSGQIVDPAGTPALVAPPDNTVTTTAAITFTWTAGSGGAPDGYEIELDGTVYTTTEPLYAATLGIGTHTWRVRAHNLAGYSSYTAPWTVTVRQVYRLYLPIVNKTAP